MPLGAAKIGARCTVFPGHVFDTVLAEGKDVPRALKCGATRAATGRRIIEFFEARGATLKYSENIVPAKSSYIVA